jgi:hypothetical protein
MKTRTFFAALPLCLPASCARVGRYDAIPNSNVRNVRKATQKVRMRQS